MVYDHPRPSSRFKEESPASTGDSGGDEQDIRHCHPIGSTLTNGGNVNTSTTVGGN
jgi:hypothetical protein